MRIFPESKFKNKENPDGLSAIEAFMQKVAILIAFVGTYFFFIKILFL